MTALSGPLSLNGSDEGKLPACKGPAARNGRKQHRFEIKQAKKEKRRTLMTKRQNRSFVSMAAAVVCLLAALSVLLTGCSKTGVFDGSRVSNEDGFRMEYTMLDKEETAELQLTEGEQLQLVFAHMAGNVDIVVARTDREPIYRGTAQENAAFILTIPETGTYRISVTGHQAKGNVSFTRMAAETE